MLDRCVVVFVTFAFFAKISFFFYVDGVAGGKGASKLDRVLVGG